ncbi:DUF2793 domain-containing protein [Devosia albogilva]|uniref:DUF2793 domain-containing protein n=1 Tax=Devosia albogilva TaxID=429726 RepID=A0ABW5QKN7_9HYPH
MDHTPRLSLPYLMPGQAQKHITHNEALRALDGLVQPVVVSRTTTAPPPLPLEGEAYLVPSGATGTWAGHADEFAIWQAGAWSFHDPAPGWQVWCVDQQVLLVFDAGAWRPLMALGDGLEQLGINATPDNTNRLAVSADATLFNHAGAGHQLKLNKATSTDTASLLLQTDWSGRAELGLAGDDSFRIKVSSDGSAWTDAITIAPASGTVSVGYSLQPAADNAVSLGAAGARWSAIWSATGTIQTSDQRQKTEIAPSDLGLDFILALEPVRYRQPAGEATHYGFIAQQVLAALGGTPSAGHVLVDPADPHSEQGLRYDSFIAPLVKAVQELAARVDELEANL